MRNTILFALLTPIMVASLAACGGDDKDSDEVDTSSETTTETSTETAVPGGATHHVLCPASSSSQAAAWL